MSALEDLETQRLGIVAVSFNMGPQRIVDRSEAWAVSRLSNALPQRRVAIHCCYDDHNSRVMLALALLVFAPTDRFRFRSHCGKQLNTK